MAIYAIGDVQGCLDELQRLIASLEFRPGADRLWFVGDLVNRGPQSLETLRYVKNLGDGAVTVLGNHDLHLLAVAEGFARHRDDDTMGAILLAPDRNGLLEWLRRRPLLYRDTDHVLVHAGLLPQWTAAFAAKLANEVEEELAGPRYREFLAHLYGSKPDRWSDDLCGADRWRVIVNAMTRMRFCSPEGVMEFATKGEADEAPAGFLPWFDVPDRRTGDEVIVCGHWSALGVRISPGVLGIDSGCVWGRQLTAIRLDDRRLFQVGCRPLQVQARRQ
jgi:bis(5'-nucleosyl)-tetraphosphatase (symmetrical)